MNERIKDFFLGDDEAWDETSEKLLAQTAERLERKFANLPFDRLQDCIAEWVAEFYFKVVAARKKACEARRNLDGGAKIDLNALKIEFCRLETSFDLRREKPFAAWAWRVLYNRCIDLSRELGNEREQFTELDESDYGEADLEDALIENFDGETETDGNLKNYLPFLRDTITNVLEADELIYFDIWMAVGPDPTGKEVIAEFAARTGSAISDASVTNLKQSFLVKSYLALREARYKAEALSVLFRRFVSSDGMQSLFFPIMLENIWRSFVGDERSVSAVRRNLPQYRWRELFQAAETALHKSKVRADILKTAHRYFKTDGSRPDFYSLIEIYSNDRFGGGIRDLFERG